MKGIDSGSCNNILCSIIIMATENLFPYSTADIQPAVVTPNVGGISTPDGSSQQYIIIGVVGAGIVLIALVVMVIAIAIMVHIRKRKSMRSKYVVFDTCDRHELQQLACTAPLHGLFDLRKSPLQHKCSTTNRLFIALQCCQVYAFYPEYENFLNHRWSILR